MKTHVLTGTKQEIADKVARLEGNVRQVIVFVDESADAPAITPGEDIFAEMAPHMVQVGSCDDSREAIYTPMEGE
jgi:hypothetical protein